MVTHRAWSLRGESLKEVYDYRIRCPMCVLDDQALRLTDKKFVERVRKGNKLKSLWEYDLQQESDEAKRRQSRAWREQSCIISKVVVKKGGHRKQLSPWTQARRC